MVSATAVANPRDHLVLTRVNTKSATSRFVLLDSSHPPASTSVEKGRAPVPTIKHVLKSMTTT